MASIQVLAERLYEKMWKPERAVPSRLSSGEGTLKKSLVLTRQCHKLIYIVTICIKKKRRVFIRTENNRL